MSKWLNNKTQIHFPDKKSNFGKEVKKPCHSCWLCPYGQLVEAFPISEKRTETSCKIFGHDCPVYYMAEPFVEDK